MATAASKPADTGTFTGSLFLALALFIGFFVWRDRAITTGSETDAAIYTLGLLSVFGLVPFFFVGVGSAMRATRFALLHGERGAVVKKLDEAIAGGGGLFSSGPNAKDIELHTRELINIYGRAAAVSGSVGFMLVLSLGAIVVLALAALQALVGNGITQNQSNLLAVYVILTTFSAFLLAWPQGASAARAFDPSGQIAKLIAAHS